MSDPTTSEQKVEQALLRSIKRLRDIGPNEVHQLSVNVRGQVATELEELRAALSKEGQGETEHRLSREDGERLEKLAKRIDGSIGDSLVTFADAAWLRRLSQGILSEPTRLVYIREQHGSVTELFATVEEAMDGPWKFGDRPADDPWTCTAKDPKSDLCTAWSACPIGEGMVYITEVAFPVAFSQPPQDDVERLREKLEAADALVEWLLAYAEGDDESNVSEFARRWGALDVKAALAFDCTHCGKRAEVIGYDRHHRTQLVRCGCTGPAPDVERLGGDCERCGGERHVWTKPPEGTIGSMRLPCPVCNPKEIDEATAKVLDAAIAERRSDPAFRARLKRSVEENSELLERLGGEEGLREGVRELDEIAMAAWRARETLHLNLIEIGGALAKAGLEGTTGKNLIEAINDLNQHMPLSEDGQVWRMREAIRALLDANPPPPLEHSKGQWRPDTSDERLEVLEIEAQADAAPEHSKGGLEENCQCHHKPGKRRCEGCPKAGMKLRVGGGGDAAGMNDAIYAAESPQPNQGSDQPKDQGGDARDAGGKGSASPDSGDVTGGGVDDGSAPETSTEDQPTDCGGSGKVPVEMFGPGSDLVPADCSGCNHPDCPNRDQAEGER